jgi:tRNA(Ile)-lysidine synthase
VGDGGAGRLSTDVKPLPDLPNARPLPRGARPLVALSGGPDSTALLLWLVECGLDVAAAHYDHALRPGSERDAAQVAALCARLGVPLVMERRPQTGLRGSVQAAARELRYAFLTRSLQATGRDLVCLGHTADDVVEGAVLHLLRGAGLAGLRGMPWRRGPFIRPFLDVWRSEIEAYLAARGVEPLRDPSNADCERFARARVRHRLLPRLARDRPGLLQRFRRVASVATELQARLEAEASALLREGYLPRAALQQAPRVVRFEAYRQLYGHLPALSRRQLEAMDQLALEGRTGAGLDLPGGRRFRVERERVTIGVAYSPAPAVPTLSVRPCPGCGDPDAVHLRAGLPLRVGYRKPGLRMRPVGAPGSRKLQDILVDAGVPRHLRDHLPLVFAGDRLAWVPGVAVDAEAVAPPGSPAWHVALDRADEPSVVPSPVAHLRSLVS